MTHAETRKRTLVDKLYSLGLSISYDRVLELSTDLGNSVCSRFESEGVVCPPKLNKGVFTTAAMDNIDHNPSSTTAQGAFHGTGISLFQHPSDDAPGEARDVVSIDNQPSKRKRLSQLPDSYTLVKPVILSKNEPVAPPLQVSFVSNYLEMTQAFSMEYKWLEHVRDEVNKDITEEIKNVSWAVYQANQVQPPGQLDTTSLLPLFQEEAALPAMICHTMDVVIKAVTYLNPGQTPVLACDQPIYAMAKKIQWNWPSTYGESSIVMMFGGLHTELAALKALGTWIEGSGWTSALVQAGITTPGTADSFLKASHVSRTRHAHQITACALYILMGNAYKHYCNCISEEEEPKMFMERRKQAELASPQFHYWSLTLHFELTILIFVRSLREGNFELYKESFKRLAPWFFALDRTNYARLLPVHIRDMESLDTKLPNLAAQFRKGHYVVNKTNRSCSALPIDHAHEQNNKIVKGGGGAIGLTESPSQLMRRMVSGPEISRIINELEASQELLKSTSDDRKHRHHEETRGVQSTFQSEVQSLSNVISEMGNPFLDQSGDLPILDTRDIMDATVVKSVRTVEELGQKQFQEFCTTRLDERKISLFDVIKRNKIQLFSSPPAPKEATKDKMKIASLKSNCSLFSRLYISCQVREGDLDSFFTHENQSYPPSLSQYGTLRSGNKSDLLFCLERLCPAEAEKPSVDVLLLDGAAIVNMLKLTGACKTFAEYSL